MVTQNGWIISTKGISCCNKGEKVYLSIDPKTRTIAEYKYPIIATVITNKCKLSNAIRIAKHWYCSLEILDAQVEVKV